jgi:hypothetical protein
MMQSPIPGVRKVLAGRNSSHPKIRLSGTAIVTTKDRFAFLHAALEARGVMQATPLADGGNRCRLSPYLFSFAACFSSSWYSSSSK